MGELDSYRWWWDIALQGVVGSIIGGLVTFGAVWLTIRSERARSDELDIRRRCERLAAEVRALQRAVMLKKWDQVGLQWFDWSLDLFELLRPLEESEPCFVALTRAAEGRLSDNIGTAPDGSQVGDPQKVMSATQNLYKFLVRRADGPGYFHGMSADHCENTVQSIREDFFVG